MKTLITTVLLGGTFISTHSFAADLPTKFEFAEGIQITQVEKTKNNRYMPVTVTKDYQTFKNCNLSVSNVYASLSPGAIASPWVEVTCIDKIDTLLLRVNERLNIRVKFDQYGETVREATSEYTKVCHMGLEINNALLGDLSPYCYRPIHEEQELTLMDMAPVTESGVLDVKYIQSIMKQ